MLRILLINDTAKKVGRLKAALTEAGFEVIDESGLTIDLPARVETVRPDVILIDTESPSRDVMEQVVLVSRDQPRPIVMFTDEHDPGVMRQAIKSGVSAYIVEGIHAQRLQPILDVAMARFESDQALRAQLLARDQQLAERKRIELAKGLLMKMKDCNEEEAYTLMRRQAMSRQQKLIRKYRELHREIAHVVQGHLAMREPGRVLVRRHDGMRHEFTFDGLLERLKILGHEILHSLQPAEGILRIFERNGMGRQLQRTERIDHDGKLLGPRLADRAFVGSGMRTVRNPVRVHGQ